MKYRIWFTAGAMSLAGLVGCSTGPDETFTIDTTTVPVTVEAVPVPATSDADMLETWLNEGGLAAFEHIGVALDVGLSSGVSLTTCNMLSESVDDARLVGVSGHEAFDRGWVGYLNAMGRAGAYCFDGVLFEDPVAMGLAVVELESAVEFLDDMYAALDRIDNGSAV